QGALAGDRTIFVGSRTEAEAYYHELAHIVLFATLPPLGRQGLIDEGAATWLGGSRGRSYAQLLPFLVRIQNENPVLPFARVNELSDEDRDIAFYSTGALLVDAVYRANGMRGVRRLLSAGRADAELYAVLSETIGVTQAGFDAWWRAEAPRRAAEPPRPFWPQPNQRMKLPARRPLERPANEE
ncbi:MAG: hypothetical protein NTY23_12260, partial [Chloroflexi bacterium]|nr:hypothetical protein [Chloroflexota bacterium]